MGQLFKFFYWSMGSAVGYNSIIFYKDHNLKQRWNISDSTNVFFHISYGIVSALVWPISVPLHLVFEDKLIFEKKVEKYLKNKID